MSKKRNLLCWNSYLSSDEKILFPSFPPQGKNLLISSLDSPGCPDMTWDESLNFCQSLGMQAISMDADKDEDQVWDVMNMLKEDQGPLTGN